MGMIGQDWRSQEGEAVGLQRSVPKLAELRKKMFHGNFEGDLGLDARVKGAVVGLGAFSRNKVWAFQRTLVHSALQ